MKTRYLQSCACIAAISTVLALCGCHGGSRGQVHDNRHNVTAALSFPKTEVPDKYYFGDGLGVNCTLELRSDHRFAFRWTGCLGEYDRNQGTWQLNGDILTVFPDKPNVVQGLSGMNLRYIPVKWRGRHFLVDENGMPGFSAMSAERNPLLIERLKSDEYVHFASDYVKAEKVRGAVGSGRPLLPMRYLPFYEKGPVKASVVRIQDSRHVIINKGSVDRVRPGLLFTMSASGDIDLEVVRVGKRESEARPVYFFNSDAPVKVGDSFTTGDTWARPHGTGYQRFSDPPIACKAKRR